MVPSILCKRSPVRTRQQCGGSTSIKTGLGEDTDKLAAKLAKRLTKTMENIGFLKIPLYKLYYLENVNDFQGFDSDDLGELRNEYSAGHVFNIVVGQRGAVKF